MTTTRGRSGPAPLIGRQEQARLDGELEQQAKAVRTWPLEQRLPAEAAQTVSPELVLRSGQAPAALDRTAAEDGYRVLLLGARGAGMSRVLLGSFATRLAASASVPVLVLGEGPGHRRDQHRVGLADRGEPRD